MQIRILPCLCKYDPETGRVINSNLKKLIIKKKEYTNAEHFSALIDNFKSKIRFDLVVALRSMLKINLKAVM